VIADHAANGTTYGIATDHCLE